MELTLKRQKICLAVLVIIAVVQIIILTCLNVYRRHLRSKSPVFKQQQMCLPFDKLIDGQNEQKCPEMLSVMTRRNATFCCGVASQVLENIIRKKTYALYNSDTNPELHSLDFGIFNCTISEERPTTLQLIGVKPFVTPGARHVGQSLHIYWDSITNEGDGLSYLDKQGVIAVLKSGFYHISTQVTFRIDNSTFPNEGDDTIRYQVIRFSAETKQQSVLLEKLISTCQMPSEQTQLPCSLGAAFKLEKGDKVFVVFYHHYQLAYGKGRNLLNIYEI
ncbi:uncharacterized protein LOC132726586 [Ruditapes philippinarum]|uniref:uncharacterized protein LOC132726586 n=1 Tax=Ruditapes philippinarum TaxID=129788 RepID=UPI00295A7EB3|nr:uncharacterized protein LOC132726586 [Ruditapes philippinarum]XP_060567905.1 uncharacterized protein LOC132726586 [Ruditapes philippinarum]